MELGEERTTPSGPNPGSSSPGPGTGVANCLSVDVEGFVESNQESVAIPAGFVDERAARVEIERNMRSVLELLDGNGVRATFFFVGTVVRTLPRLVEEVAGLGHEVASHSYEHVRLFGLDPKIFGRELAGAKAELEDLSGKRVHGFRAPEFSITERSLWAVDVLAELGFTYDSSIYPIGVHDVYGMRDADPNIHRFPNGLIEFPLATTEILGRRVPFGGGGYFRLYPVGLTRALIARSNRSDTPCMCFVHPYEIGPVAPRIPGLSAYRRFRHYYHCSKGGPRLGRLLRTFRFVPAVDVLRERGLLGD